MGPTAISERVELAKLCSSRDWSKAIRILDSLLSQSTSIQDICNRAFCYSQLELHKHVIKDCDRALQLDPALLQAYILKGRALSSLGRNEDAVLVWEQGCEHALRQSADLKQLLELEDLLNLAKQDRSNVHETHVNEARLFTGAAESGHLANGKSSDNSMSQNKLSDISESCNGSMNASEIYSESGDNLEMHNGLCNNAGRNSPMSVLESGHYTNGKSSEACINPNESGDMSTLCSELGDASEIFSKSVDKINTANGFNDEGGENEEPDGQRNEACDILPELSQLKEPDGQLNGTRDILPELSQLKEPDGQLNGTRDILPKLSQLKEPDGLMNGTLDILPKLSHDSVSCNSLSSTSEPSRNLSIVCGSSGDGSGMVIKSNNGTDMHTETSNEPRRNKKFCVTRISKTKSISIDFRLSRGIAQVNEAKYASAISIFDQILREDPTYPEALIGRGTAYAFQRELESAIADFSKAIESNASAVEAWKRRGQARAALGESAEAIEDLTRALEFEPNSADILHERGIVNFKFKDFTAAIEDLSACVKLDKDNKSAFTYLGLAFSSIGEYKRAEEAHSKSIQLDRSFLEAWAHLTQFYLDLANSTKAFECIEQVLQIDIRFAKAYHLRGLLLHGLGEHRKAIKDLSVGLRIESSNIECLYLRASCYHAVGEYADAVKDYDAALDLELDSIEKFVLQCLAFYQKEIALYTASKVNSEFCWFDIDGDIDPLFKEYWCKRLHPKHVCEKVFRQPPLRESLKRGKLRKQEFTMTKQKTALLLAADSIGQKIQYDCPGFLPNRRQHRMAGLAAIEIAQKVSKAWRSLQAEWKHANKGSSKYGKRGRRRINMLSQNRGGAGCSTSSSSETSSSYGTTEDRSGRSLMSWQDIYSLAVKWRQISEPCDPIVWINKLSEEFNTGFGSHTPMILGQAKVFRYYPNFERTFDLAKAIMKEKLYVRNKADEIIHIPEEKLQDIMDADTCSDLYKVVCEDFWLATWCNSTAVEEKQLEGTRISVAKMGEHGYDFAIRTPCTSSRWDDFDAEMATAWEAVCNAYCGENYGSNDLNVLENVRNVILRMTFYWYNFMPLSRGSAVVGFTVLLGLLLAANMEFTGKIPKGLQVDWEAILNFEPDSFVDSVKSWLYPSLKVTTSWKDFPDVANTFSTTGSVVAALSSYDN